ncbi:MAG: hypothetical protein IIZ73_10185 [Ruminococcus sp.]|nr:hypothetical protein [Ruminococcus sp.]
MQTRFFISAALNLIAFMLTAVGLCIMLKGIGNDGSLSADSLSSIKYFTVQSNLLFGIVAGIFAVCQLIYRSPEKLPHPLYLIKYIATVGVAITMLTVVLFLAPVVVKSYPPLFRGANLYFHLLVPLVGIVSFCLFEKSAEITLPQTFLGLIPFILYAVYYTANALTHSENGKVPPQYDWYYFLANGADKALPVLLIMLFSATAVCFGLRFLNRLRS